MLGIGVITYNRLPHLQECLTRVWRFTRVPYQLVVADDGSTDGTVQWCREQNVLCVSGENLGCAGNKNRALHALFRYSQADPLLLLEEDCWPDSGTWAEQWIWAAERWGHVNWRRAFWRHGEHILSGFGTWDHPYEGRWLTGQCTVSTRRSVEEVGYLDPRFRGYGEEHLEWSDRFARAGYEGAVRKLSLDGGLADRQAQSYANAPDYLRNLALKKELANESIYREPWLDTAGRERLEREIAQAFHWLEGPTPDHPRPDGADGLRMLRAHYPFPSQRPEFSVDRHGWFNAENREALARLVREDMQVIAQVGCWTGLETDFLLHRAPRATLFAIDHWKGGQSHQRSTDEAIRSRLPTLYERFVANTWEARDRVVPVREAGVRGLQLLHTHGIAPDLLYLDAGNEPECFDAILKAALELFPRTPIVGDDYWWESVRSSVQARAGAAGRVVESDRGCWYLPPRSAAHPPTDRTARPPCAAVS